MATATQRDLARWILERECGDLQDSDAVLGAAERASAKLCGRLAQLVTVEGSRALLARALHLARGEFPFLAGVQAGATPDTYLAGLERSAHGADPERVRAGLLAVLAGMIGLLATFVGDDLTLRLLRGVWSDLPPDAAGFGSGEEM